jgi:hypothetical protein
MTRARLLAAPVAALLACGGSTNEGSFTGPPSSSNPGDPAAGAYFPRGAVWSRDVSGAPLDPQAAAVIANLDRAGWGLGRMQIDFSLEVLEAGPNTPILAFTPTEDHFRPDCDLDPVPVPPGGALEGETDYECRSDGDCHLIVTDRPQRRLYEMWRAHIAGGVFRGGCLAVWDMSRVYSPTGRGEQCTSADAAGFPVAPLSSAQTR